MALGDSTASGRSCSGAAQGGGVVAARGAAWDACAREEVPRGGPGGAKRFHAAAYGGRREQSRPGEREMEIRAYL